jgi:hypothetical protein
MRRTPISPFSAKKLAALKAAGLHPSSTLTNRGTLGAKSSAGNGLPAELRRKPMKATYRSTGPDLLTVQAVWVRDLCRCAWCGEHVDPYGERSMDWSIQHRRPRRAGGDPRPETNLPGNLVLYHGSGTTSCHGKAEGSERAKAIDTGHILPAVALPYLMPITHAVHGRVWLTDDAGVSDVLPEVAA